MGFFSRIFGLGPTKTSAQVGARAEQVRRDIEARPRDGSIRYDPRLVDSLKDDHHTLFRIYSDLVRARDCDEFEAIGLLLYDFKYALQTHLMVENVRFYVYLQQQYSIDRDTSAFIAELRRDMDSIAHTAVKFVNTYASFTEFTPQMKSEFSANLAAIGDVLTKRVALEESRLYTLYQPA